MKKLTSIIITISMLLSSVHAFAISGEGTEANPYLISSASDIAKIHDDLDGYYKLTSDIDMSGVDFEPIGNEWEGPFTGTIDGAEHTISNLNLNLPGNKYVGFTGYLEGAVKDLTLKNIDCSGYLYVGGIAGYAGADVYVSNCEVSGNITCSNMFSTMYIGGIVGYFDGSKIEYCDSNCVLSCDKSARIGGIVGFASSASTISNCENFGEVTSLSNYVRMGGVAGVSEGEIYSCNNYSNISNGDGYGVYIGGIVGLGNSINNCCNYGNVDGGYGRIGYSDSYAGGISGNFTFEINHSINVGHVTSDEIGEYNRTGGIAGTGENSSCAISSCINQGFVSSKNYSGGIVGSGRGEYLDQKRMTINNSVNYYGYMVGQSISRYSPNQEYSQIEINSALSISDAPNLVYRDYWNTPACKINNVYNLANNGITNDGKNYLINKFKFNENFEGFDFDNIWYIGDRLNSGFPQLKNMPEHIVLSECVEIMEIGDTDILTAYIGENEESVVWSSDDSSVATVSSDGVVVATGIGNVTITATNVKGMKANCLIYVYGRADSIEMSKSYTSITSGSSETLTYTQNPGNANEVVIWSSSDDSVAVVDKDGKVTAKKIGNAIITATTVNSEISTSCTVTVTGNPITSVSLSPASTTMNVDETKTLTLSISPTQYEGTLNWNSTNVDVATVNNNGTITAKTPGTTVISVTSDTNKTAQCTVTVKAPVTEISFAKPEITIVKGYTEKLVPIINPTNTTDTLSWSSSSTSYASVAADGTVTANRVGTATITVTASNGKKAYCVANVVDPTIPVSSVTIDKSEVILTKTDTVQLNATVLPSDSTNKELTWTSSDGTIATVSTSGVVTAVKEGVARITATADNGVYHECIIKVVSASGPSIVLTPENAIPNAISKVKARIVRNPGISGYKFTINYDDTLLTPVSVSLNEEFGGTLTTNLDDENRTQLNVLWYSDDDTNVEINGELFTIDFKVSETAELGDYSDVTIEYGAKDICNTAGENIALYTESAKVTVEEPLPGDIYEDGDVNVYDLTLLARYMTGLADFTDRQMEAANVTDDDLVDIKDVVKLAQYIVGWSGVELMSLRSLDAGIAETPVVTVGTSSVNEANEAEIPVYITGNTGIAGYRFVLDYNADDIEIASITPSEFINSENFGTNLGQENDEGLIVFCYQEGNVVTDGELFTVKVRYKNPTDTSISPISIKSAENNFCNQTIENVICNYETGYALGDDYIVANKVVGDTNFTCELYFDDSYEEQSAKAIIAFYDTDGRMVQLMPKDITVKPGKVDLSINYDKKAYATYKLMIWEGMGNLKPITEVK